MYRSSYNTSTGSRVGLGQSQGSTGGGSGGGSNPTSPGASNPSAAGRPRLGGSTHSASPAFGSLAVSGGRPGSSGSAAGLRAASAGIGSRFPTSTASSFGTQAAAAASNNSHTSAGLRGGSLTTDNHSYGGGAGQQQQQQRHQVGSPLSRPGSQGGGGAPTGSPAAGSTQSMLRSLRPGSSSGGAGGGGAGGTHSSLALGSSGLTSSSAIGGGHHLHHPPSSVTASRPATAGLSGGIAGARTAGTTPLGSPAGAGGHHHGSGGNSGNGPAFSCSVLASSSRSSAKPLQLHYGSGCTQGFRPTMEDEHINLVNAKTVDGNPLSLFAVLDGHCGRRVAELGSQMLPEALFNHPLIGQNNAQAFVESVMQIDKQIFHAIRNQDGGATLISALVHKRMLFVACLGDARAVLCDSGQAVPMSIDHKPTDPGEQARIVRCGGFVHFGRVSGCLAVSRALGDFEFKISMGRWVQKEFQVSNVSDIRQINITDGSRFLIIACDGLWDVMSNEEAVAWVNEYLGKHESALIRDTHTTLNRASQAMAEAAVSKGSTDNVSVTILLFHTPGGGSG